MCVAWDSGRYIHRISEIWDLQIYRPAYPLLYSDTPRQKEKKRVFPSDSNQVLGIYMYMYWYRLEFSLDVKYDFVLTVPFTGSGLYLRHIQSVVERKELEGIELSNGEKEFFMCERES